MRSFRIFALIGVLAAAAFVLFGFRSQDQIDRKQLRDMLVQLGYEVTDIVKDAGKEKYSVKLTRDGLDIPIGYEISPSGGYIWLTVNLGEKPTLSGDKALALLKQNAKIQPSFFYFTASNRVMCALAIENRGGVTNTMLRQKSESLAENVGKTKGDWQ